MAKKTKVDFHGSMEDAEELDFEIESQPWSVYKLEDGTVFRMHHVLVAISRLLNKTQDDGDPIYSFTYTAIPRIEPPQPKKKAARRKTARRKTSA